MPHPVMCVLERTNHNACERQFLKARSVASHQLVFVWKIEELRRRNLRAASHLSSRHLRGEIDARMAGGNTTRRPLRHLYATILAEFRTFWICLFWVFFSRSSQTEIVFDPLSLPLTRSVYLLCIFQLSGFLKLAAECCVCSNNLGRTEAVPAPHHVRTDM